MKTPRGEHHLASKDPDSRTGVCAKCGPVLIIAKRSRGKAFWRCAIAVRTQKGPSYNNWHRHPGPRGAHGLTLIAARAAREGKTCALDGCDAPADHIDHCHKTGKLRDPLCARHNLGLGFFDDDPAMLRAAAGYVERHRD